MSDIGERLCDLRGEMKKTGITMYYIPSDDFHGSEYVSEYFKSREYISGFTGSAGEVIVTQDNAWLWTDGRYFIQAEKQLSGTEYTLNRAGEPGVPGIKDFIPKHLDGGILGFDGRVVPAAFAEQIEKSIGKEHMRTDLDLIGMIRTDRPALPSSKAYLLDEKYTGESRTEKIRRVRGFLERMKADVLLLSTLDDICWLLNVRGDDVEYNPVILSYLAVTVDKVLWFADRNKLSDDIISALDGITIMPYDDFYGYISSLPEKCTVYLDKKRLNSHAFSLIPDSAKKVSGTLPTTLFKCIKNDTEIKNMRHAHLKDGIALTKFIHRIKTGPAKYTELSAAELIMSLRKAQPGYVSESFTPIIAYAEHGAIVHYSADESSDVPLAAESFVLCDTGGHYLDGTTDVTRTICLGKPTAEMKAAYTAVLRGNLCLSAAVFRHGARGANLDILARMPVYEFGSDFNHGTGHGVGFLLNVHEGPNAVRSKISGDPADSGCVFESGMITSDEPGIYIEGSYGIRTENLILCKKLPETEYINDLLGFEVLTLAPYDPDAVEPSLMTDREIRLYNEYQQRVYCELSPYLDADEAKWLRNETRSISKTI